MVFVRSNRMLPWKLLWCFRRAAPAKIPGVFWSTLSKFCLRQLPTSNQLIPTPFLYSANAAIVSQGRTFTYTQLGDPSSYRIAGGRGQAASQLPCIWVWGSRLFSLYKEYLFCDEPERASATYSVRLGQNALECARLRQVVMNCLS